MSSFNLSNDDVLSMNEDASFSGTQTSTSHELMTALGNWLYQQSDLNTTAASDWVDIGVNCRVLTVQGVGWKTGKARLRIEFTPDQTPKQLPPVESLDDLRSDLDT